MKEVNEKYLKEIYLNILKAIVVVFYFLVLNLAYENINSEYLRIGTKLFTMIFLLISIYIFEKAYKKDNGNLAIQGIEILVLSAYTLTSEHITNKFNFGFKNYSAAASYIFAIYFIMKCIIIYTKGRKELAENISDIREIVKKEEPVKREATKKNKDIDAEEKVKVDNKNTNKDKAKAMPKEKKTTSKGKNNVKAKNTTSTRKKSSTQKNNIKKNETTKIEKESTNRKSKENQNLEEKPKRKKVKKEVKEND